MPPWWQCCERLPILTLIVSVLRLKVPVDYCGDVWAISSTLPCSLTRRRAFLTRICGRWIPSLPTLAVVSNGSNASVIG